MTNRTEIIERRDHMRFKTQEGAFATLRGQISKLGQIIDISKGGLAFRYIDTGDPPNESSELDIFLAEIGFHLEKIAFKTISDSEADREHPFSTIKMRRRGVQFTVLKQDQISQLEYFIQNHTTGETPRNPVSSPDN